MFVKATELQLHFFFQCYETTTITIKKMVLQVKN